jgi:hypothetical protein
VALHPNFTESPYATLDPAERCSALQTPPGGTSHEPIRLLAHQILEITD